MAKAPATTPKDKPPSSIMLADDLSAIPDFMRPDVGKGTENIGMEDMDTPRIKLMQGLSPELESHTDLRIGHFYHTANDLSLGASFRAVAVYTDQRYILWRPRDMGGGILARADDGEHWQPANREFEVTLDKKMGGAKVKWTTADTVARSGLAEWGSMNPDDPDSQPAATLMYNFVLAFPDRPDLIPAVISFQRTSVRAAKKLNSKLKTVRSPMFGLVLQFEQPVIVDAGSAQRACRRQARDAGADDGHPHTAHLAAAGAGAAAGFVGTPVADAQPVAAFERRADKTTGDLAGHGVL